MGWRRGFVFFRRAGLFPGSESRSDINFVERERILPDVFRAGNIGLPGRVMNLESPLARTVSHSHFSCVKNSLKMPSKRKFKTTKVDFENSVECSDKIQDIFKE